MCLLFCRLLVVGSSGRRVGDGNALTIINLYGTYIHNLLISGTIIYYSLTISKYMYSEKGHLMNVAREDEWWCSRWQLPGSWQCVLRMHSGVLQQQGRGLPGPVYQAGRVCCWIGQGGLGCGVDASTEPN